MAARIDFIPRLVSRLVESLSAHKYLPRFESFDPESPDSLQAVVAERQKEVTDGKKNVVRVVKQGRVSPMVMLRQVL